MARKRQVVEEHVNHERWLVSYADFITLLFAFFVVMYSMSSVNEDKYRVLSDAMALAFQDPKSSLQPIQVGQPVRSLVAPAKGASESATEQELLETEGEFSQRALDQAEDEVNAIADIVEGRMKDLIDEEIIDIKRNKFWLEVEIKSSLLFTSGSSQLILDSIPALVKLSSVFLELPNRINVEGFTDNRPIQSRLFPSNWELSSARAAAVVRLFERSGVAPSRLASVGYGEHQPISDNSTADERAQNRRVVVVVMASLNDRRSDRLYEFKLLKEKVGG